MLQDHSFKVRKTSDTCEKMSHISFSVLLFSCLDTCDTGEKMSYISLCVLLYSCLGGLFHTLEVQNRAKIAQTNIAKNAVAIS